MKPPTPPASAFTQAAQHLVNGIQSMHHFVVAQKR